MTARLRRSGRKERLKRKRNRRNGTGRQNRNGSLGFQKKGLSSPGRRDLPSCPGAGREALKAVGFEDSSHVSDAAALCKKLLDRDDVDLIDASRVIVRSGDEYVTKAVTEYIYPTEYNLRIESPISTNSQSSASANSLHSQNCALSAVEPTKFTMREVGSIVQMTPTLTLDCRLVDIVLNVQFVSDPVWKDYGVKVPPATPSRYDLPMEQPFFPVRSVDVKTAVKPGQTMVFVGGGLSQKESGNKTLLVFVTLNLVAADM